MLRLYLTLGTYLHFVEKAEYVKGYHKNQLLPFTQLPSYPIAFLPYFPTTGQLPYAAGLSFYFTVVPSTDNAHIPTGSGRELRPTFFYDLKLLSLTCMFLYEESRNGQDCSSHFPVAVTMSEFIETGMQQSYGCHHLGPRRFGSVGQCPKARRCLSRTRLVTAVRSTEEK